MMRMVPSNSFNAKIKLEKMPLTDAVSDPVATRPSAKMPAIQSSVVSLFRTMNPMMSIIQAT
ncbi:hypothetical protein D3C78_1885580 [compost metagenome]